MTDGTLIPPPSWYDPGLPKFYRLGNGEIHVYPLNAVPKYTEQNVLDLLLYYQMIIGYNRIDATRGGLLTGAARSAAWSSNGWTAKIWAQSAFQANASGDGSGDWANVPTTNMGIDSALETALVNRYIELNKTQMPWLSDMQAVGGGIDLMTIPMSTDTEVPRPSWYPKYLPSLFISSGQPYQQPAGSMNTKPKIKNYKSSGYTQYTIKPSDVANLMLYAQPVIYAGPTPYPCNWYINDVVNGAVAFRFKIALAYMPGFTDAQEQAYGAVGNMMVAPVLDANPWASGFSQTMEGIIKFVVQFFSAKIPGGTSLDKVATTAASLGGAGITGADSSPAGTFSAAVFSAADTISAGMQKKATQRNILLMAIGVFAIGWWAHDEGYI